MLLSFRQGIVDYDFSTFPFPVAGSGTSISLKVGTRPIILTLAQGTNNYTFVEHDSVPGAWIVPNSGQSWLYWDFNTATFERTFGYTTLQPYAQASDPTRAAINPLVPQNGQMWYDTATYRNYVWKNGGWTEVLRVFAAKYSPLVAPIYQLTSLGDQPLLPSGYPNFTGTQIGDNQPNVAAGLPLFDYNGVILRRSDGTFLTTESSMFAEGVAVTGVRLESNVYTAQSSDASVIPAFSVVAFQTTDGTIQLGSYDDAGNTTIALAIQDIPSAGTGGVTLQGTVTNPAWNWTGSIGQLLWISGANPGQLIDSDPHADNPIAYPIAQPPVARVLTTDSIIFLQGIGTKGPKGAPGSVAGLAAASPTVAGIVYLSTDSGAFTPAANVVIAEGDPRLADARIALSSSILAATNITVAPDPASGTTAANVQLALQALGSNKLGLSGGTMTGVLTLSANPTSAYQAATKQYVDTAAAAVTASSVQITGSTMTGSLYLNANPTQPLQAVTKQYVDNVAGGITFQASVTAASTTDIGAIYSGSPNYTLTATSNGVFTIDGETPSIGARVLIKNQTIASENGIYDVTDTGSATTPFVLTRDAEELPPNTVVSGTFAFVNTGVTQNSTGWILSTANPITLDTTYLTFVQFSSAANVTSNSIITALGYTPVGPFTVASSNGLTVNGSPVSGATPSGIVLNLSTELRGLNNLSTSGYGVVQRTGAGTYVAQALTSPQITTALGYIPLATATLNTAAPLAGGGTLTSSGLTLSILPFTGSGAGAVPVSPGGTSAFLRADGQWATPPGGAGGGGGVTSIGLATTSAGVIISGTNPITSAGTINVDINTELQGLSSLATIGVVQRTGAGTYTAAPYPTTLVGDVTGGPSATTITTTLAVANNNPGTYGNANNIPVITVNAKGLATAVSQIAIANNHNSETVFATAGQSVVDFSLVTTTPQTAFPAGVASQQIFVNGVMQREDNSNGNGYTPNPSGSFYVSGPNQITFFVGLTAGDEVIAYQLY